VNAPLIFMPHPVAPPCAGDAHAAGAERSGTPRSVKPPSQSPVHQAQDQPGLAPKSLRFSVGPVLFLNLFPESFLDFLWKLFRNLFPNIFPESFLDFFRNSFAVSLAESFASGKSSAWHSRKHPSSCREYINPPLKPPRTALQQGVYIVPDWWQSERGPAIQRDLNRHIFQVDFELKS
jgi:hypothetical protein